MYGELGVRKIINAAGTFTAMGGSLMPPEVVAAWNAASKNFVDLLQLQNRVGEKIASLLGVEAALVTTGAAGGMQLGTAAAQGVDMLENSRERGTVGILNAIHAGDLIVYDVHGALSAARLLRGAMAVPGAIRRLGGFVNQFRS